MSNCIKNLNPADKYICFSRSGGILVLVYDKSWAFISISCYYMNTGFSLIDANAYPYLVRAGSYNQTGNVQLERHKIHTTCILKVQELSDLMLVLFKLQFKKY